MVAFYHDLADCSDTIVKKAVVFGKSLEKNFSIVKFVLANQTIASTSCYLTTLSPLTNTLGSVKPKNGALSPDWNRC